jgi:hypothetical protein
MRRTAQLLRSLLSILLMTASEGIQFLWLAVSSRAELSAEVLFLPKQLAFYRDKNVIDPWPHGSERVQTCQSCFPGKWAKNRVE